MEHLEGDDAHALGMQEWELPCGLFAVERVEDWPGNTGKIAQAFQRLLTDYDGRIRDWGWSVAEYLGDKAVNVLIQIHP